MAEVNKLIKMFEKMKLSMKKLSKNKGMQAQLMQQMGIDPSQMAGALGGASGMGGLGGLGNLKGMNMNDLKKMASKMGGRFPF